MSYLKVHKNNSNSDYVQVPVHYQLYFYYFLPYVLLSDLEDIDSHLRSNRTARKRPETAVVIRQTRNVYKNGVKRWSFRSKKRPEMAVVIRTDGLR
jgi:hypothetical protein